MTKLKSCILISMLVLLATLDIALATHAAESEGCVDRWLAPSVNQTHVFQQGLDGYTGVRDTWISDDGWDDPPQYTVNYGQNEELYLSYGSGGNPLLGFDLTSIPTNSPVLSALSGALHTASGLRMVGG